ncbi:MAG: O-antigen ligase family protein [Gemmatimonadota bacterium]|nr:O-antigen ligase family protein [Gemmatimonadota bacterium]
MPDDKNILPQGITVRWLLAAAGLGLSLTVPLAVAYLPLKLALGALAALVLVGLTLWRPVWGLAAICALLTVEGISVSGRGVTEIRLLGMAVFAAWLLHVLVSGKAIRVNGAFWTACAFVAWAGLSFLWAKDTQFAAPRYGTLVQLLFFFLMAINVLEREKDLCLVLGAWVAGTVGTSMLSLNLQAANLFERARTFEAQNPNDYGMVVGLGIVAGVYLAGRAKSPLMKLLCILGTSCITFPFLLAQSRGAWLAVAAAGAVFLWHTKRRLRNILVVAVVVTTTIVTAFSLGYINTSLIQRTSDLMTLTSRGTTRFDVWRCATNVFLDHPVAGVGFGQFPRVYNRYRYITHGIKKDLFPARDPHSLYFEVASELGLVGLALLGTLFWQIWQRKPPGAEANLWFSLALLAFIMVAGISMTILRSKFFWLALAFSARAKTFSRGSPENCQETE